MVPTVPKLKPAVSFSSLRHLQGNVLTVKRLCLRLRSRLDPQQYHSKQNIEEERPDKDDGKVAYSMGLLVRTVLVRTVIHDSFGGSHWRWQ